MTAKSGPFPDPATWPYAQLELPLRDGRLRYIRSGAGSPLVLVHGTPTWSYEWRHAIPGLARRFEVTAFDHLGFGLSERPRAASYTPEAHSARFREAIDLLYPEGKISLVVHDFGGPIALDWVLDHPERIANLVVVNSWMWPFTDDPKMRKQAILAGSNFARFLYRRANASLRMIMPSAYGDRSRLTREIHRQYLAPFPDADSRERVLFALAKSLAGSEAFFRSLWDRRARLREVPVAILWGMKDSALRPAFLDRWREAAPHARMVEFEDAGHWPHEEVPEEFNRALEGAIEGAI